MAPFNPKINPTNDPTYGGTSHPIDVPENIRPRGVETNQIMPEGPKQGDTSAEYAGKADAAGMQAEGAELTGFGDLFKNVAAVGDFAGKAGVAIVKKDIEDKVYNIADRERQAYTDALEKIKAGVGVKNVLTAGASDDGTPVPDDISNLSDTLSTLSSARDSGKISSAYYAGRLLAEAKQLRAQYPGFREEIDQQFAKVTGMNPANAYIHSLVSDINKAASSTASQRNKTLNYIRNNLGFPNAEDKYKLYERGLISDDDVYKWAAPYEQEKFQLNQRALKFNDTKLTREEKAMQGGENFDVAAGIAVGRSVDTLLGKMGLNSAQDAANLDSKTKAGAIPAQQWSQIGQQIADHKVMLKTAMLADADKYGYTKVLGKPEVIKRADAALSALDTLADRVYNKDSGGLYAAAQYIKGLQDEDTKDLLTNSKIGPIYRQVQVQKQIGGEQWMQKFNLDTISSDVPKQYKAYFDGWSRAITGQANETPTTFNDFIDEVKSKGVASAKLNKAVMGQIDRLSAADTPDGIKLNIAKAAFDPANRGMIAKLPMDGVDPSTGRPVTGQNAMFQRFTSPEITKEMYRLGQQHPEVWTNYLNWTKETLANELVPHEIKSLSAIPPTAPVRVGWDSDNKMFVPVDTRTNEQKIAESQARGGSGGSTGNTYFNQVQQMTNRLNANIGNFKRVAENSGMNVDAFVLRTIADAAGPDALRNVNGIPYNIMRDIGLTNLKKKTQ